MNGPKWKHKHDKSARIGFSYDGDGMESPPKSEINSHPNDFIEIYSTYHQDDIAFIKSVLDSENITYLFQGESSILLIAAGAYARLLVHADDTKRATEILKELGFISPRFACP